MKKGFTLIELLAVIVILAIIAVIAVPIVLNIINDSKENSNKRSIDMYAKAVENAVASYKLNGNSLSGLFETTDGKTVVSKSDSNVKLNVEYTGSEVVCEIFEIYSDGTTFISSCYVDDVLVENYSKGDVCKVISGSGKESGDQISCAGEHFYVISNEGTLVLMLAEKNIMLDLNKPIQSNEAGTTAYFGPLATWDDGENGGYCPDPNNSRGKSEIVNGEEQILPTKYINAYQTYLINNGVNNAVASIPEIPYNCNYQVGSYGGLLDDQTCYEVYEETWDSVGNLIDKKLIKEKAESWYLSTNYWISKLDDYICSGIAVGKDMHNGIWYTNEAGVRPAVTIPTSILK